MSKVIIILESASKAAVSSILYVNGFFHILIWFSAPV